MDFMNEDQVLKDEGWLEKRRETKLLLKQSMASLGDKTRVVRMKRRVLRL